MRRRGQSDERRRRVFTEDAAAANSNSKKRKTGKSSAASDYHDAALQQQVRITDFVPRSAWAFALLVAWGTAMIAGLLTAYNHVDPTSGRTAIFDLSWTGSLANWFASFTLILVAASAIICYSLRRHKLSDYHGRYRIWIWTAVAALLASIATTTSWHRAVGWEISRAVSWTLPGGAQLWWLVPCVLVVSLLAIRLLLEMKGCRGAAIGLLSAALCYSIVVGHQLMLSTPTASPQTVMITTGSLLAGHFLLMLSFLWFARHVIRDIQGLLPKRESQTTANPSGRSESSRREDPAHKQPSSPARRTDLEPQVDKRQTRLLEAAEEEQDRYEEEDRRVQRKTRTRRRPADHENDEPQVNRQRKLTKSDRKRLRKLKAQQREAA